MRKSKNSRWPLRLWFASADEFWSLMLFGAIAGGILLICLGAFGTAGIR